MRALRRLRPERKFARQRVPFAAAPRGRTASLARRLDMPPAAVDERADTAIFGGRGLLVVGREYGLNTANFSPASCNTRYRPSASSCGTAVKRSRLSGQRSTRASASRIVRPMLFVNEAPR